ncbi:MAG: glycosyl hydrolase [Oscillospiraceae bacterium]|nr:glycosyl hydrolase [Oscillospiraceae bacterium]
MTGKFRKAAAFVTAAIMSFSSASVLSAAVTGSDNPQPLFRAECEDGALTGVTVTDNIYNTPKPGFSGDGFVWMQNGGSITFDVTAPETGMYAISTKYMQELSEEGRLQYLYINGKQTGSYMLPYCKDWQNFDFGVQRLEKGVNTIEIRAGWGFAYFDTFTVDYGNLPALDCEPVLTDTNATKETQSLMNYLCDVYGEHTISGQQEIYGDGHDGNYEYEFDFIHDFSDKYPAIRGFDFMNYNPLYGWDDNTTERAIDWVNEKGGIATASWHINVPKDFANYTVGEEVDWQACTYKPDGDFDTAKAVVEGTKEYDYLMAAIEDMAEQLARLQEAGVPIILRPFHEAEGNGGLKGEGAWFWWGAAGADVYRQLWTLLYTTLTEKYDLHNIIWEYNSYTYATSDAWYPGNDLVDIVAYDKYNVVYNRYDGLSNCPNEDAISSIFYELVKLTDGKKLVAMSENDTIPNLDNLVTEKAGWLYFCPWYGEFIDSETYNYVATMKELYQSDYVITLDELPDLKTYAGGSSSTKDPLTGDVNNDKSVNASDLLALKNHLLGGTAAVDTVNSDLNSDSKVNIIDLILLIALLLK